MRNEQQKILIALLSLVIALITFFILAENIFSFSLGSMTIAFTGIVASAYAAFCSLYISRRLERKRTNRKVFIIYSHKDKDRAIKLTDNLKEMGYNPWLDEHEIVPGQNWTKAVYQAIENSSVALFLSSKNTEEHEGFAYLEMKAAREVLRSTKESQSPIIPIYLEESKLPEELKDIHAVKLFEDNGIEQLDKGLKYLFGNST